jgi:hypothetical protein
MVKTTCSIAIFIIALLSVSIASAIPETDLNKFRASGRFYPYFSQYTNETQYQTISAFHGESDYFYLIVRAHAGDAVPYDDFHLQFRCLGDEVPTELHTTDYPSWVEAGFISFKREYAFDDVLSYYDGTAVNTSWSYCWLITADSLSVNGNAGYTQFYIELVPVLENTVITLNELCGDSERANLINELSEGISLVLEMNVNIIYTIWIVFQILVVILIVIGIPILLFMLIRWAIWRVTGVKLFERRTNA